MQPFSILYCVSISHAHFCTYPLHVMEFGNCTKQCMQMLSLQLGETPLHRAAQQGSRHVTKCLVQAGATIDAQNRVS